jgi:deoxyribose-phosphate aldolase
LADAEAMLAAGATRLGTSAGITIAQEAAGGSQPAKG